MALMSSSNKKKGNTASKRGGNPFQYGTIPPLATLSKGTANSSMSRIGRPSLGSIPMSALNGVKSRIDAAQAMQANPLGDPGAAATLQGIQAGLSRQKTAALGQAKGRAAGSGQAAFQGALASTAAGLEQGQSDAFADASATLAAQLSEQGRTQELAYLKLQADAENEANRNAMQKYGIDAELGVNEARLAQANRQLEQSNLMDQAKLAEQARQFGITADQDASQFDAKLANDESQFGKQLAFNEKQATFSNKFDQDKLDLTKRESDFSKAKDILSTTAAARDMGLAGDQSVLGALKGVGVRPVGGGSSEYPSHLNRRVATTRNITTPKRRLF